MIASACDCSFLLSPPARENSNSAQWVYFFPLSLWKDDLVR